MIGLKKYLQRILCPRQEIVYEKCVLCGAETKIPVTTPQLKKEKIIFKDVVNYVRRVAESYIVAVRTLNKKYTRVEV